LLSNFAFKFKLCRYIVVRASKAELGMAVQVDPLIPMLKAPGTKRLKLNYDEPLSNFAFEFNLRRYSWGCCRR